MIRPSIFLNLINKNYQMNEIDVLKRSHELNAIMLQFDLLSILSKCVEIMVIIPRFELISVLDILAVYMIEKNKYDDQFIKKLDNLTKEAETWILSEENRNFSKKWNSREIPEKIQQMYINFFGFDVNELIEEYVTDFEEFGKRIEVRQTEHLRKWHRGKKESETEKKPEDLQQTHLEELENDKKIQEQRENDKIYKGGKTFKEREREKEEMAKERPKESKKMEKIKEIIDLKYMNSIQEIKKGDKERFAKIFYAFEKKLGSKIPEEKKNMIMRLWYGDYFAKEQYNSDDILNIVKKYSLSFKISNDHINGEANRLILQTYIVGLYMGVSVFVIYTIINDVLEANPSMSVHKIMPSMIHNGNVPNLKVQEVLNPIITHLSLQEDQNIIRVNWNKIRYPNIDILAVLKEIQSFNIDATLKYKINTSIEDLSENIVTKGLTIERFAREVYQILKKQTVKIPITEKQIVSLLSYA
jgi:hypothetical protein